MNSWEILISKKFIGFLFITTLVAILVLAGKVPGEAIISFITLNFGIYVGGNVGEAIAKK